MADEKRRFKTTIAGRTYTIVGKKSVEHLETVSEIANDTIRQLMAAQPSLDIEQRSILVAVNTISENISKQAELEFLKEQNTELEKKVEQLKRRVQRLQNQINEDKTVQEKNLESQEVEPTSSKSATNRPKTKLIKPNTTSASQIVLQKTKQEEISHPFTGRKGLPANSRKKLENKAAQKKNP